jgi:hypothetical protein
MTEPTCACHQFHRLEGAATQAYITNYLERDAATAHNYRCRVCGARWRRIEDENRKRPSLVRLDAENQPRPTTHQ